MNKVTFKSDVRKKLILLGIIPLILLSILLIIKIYFTLEDMNRSTHTKVLKAIDYKLNDFFDEIIYKAHFLQKNKTNRAVIHTKMFLKLNKELNSIIILDKKGTVLNVASKFQTKLFKGFDFSQKEIYKKFIKYKKPFFSNIHLSAVTNQPTISYIFGNSKYTFIFNINLKSIESYITYIQNNNDLGVIISDNYGRYIVNTLSKHHKETSSFFLTDIYNKAVKDTEPFEYKEITDNCKHDMKLFVMYLKNKRLNWFVVTTDKDRIDTQILYIALWTLSFIAIIILFMLFGAAKFTNQILVPLEVLINRMERFANSKDTEKLIINIEYPLFRKIANSFNTMQEKIIKREKELQELNNSLEQKVLEQTQELQDINKTLEKRVKEEIEKNKQKEQMLFEQSKMAAMGEMIGNIAHQWRQPLSVISTVASGLKMKYEMGIFKEEEFIKYMDQIVSNTKFLSSTIDDFRNFFKKDKEKSNFYLQTVIEKNLSLLEATLKNNDITLIDKTKNIELFGYENELIQAMLNILNNAKDILKDNDIEDKIIILSSKVEENKLILNIHDNGGGVPNNIINRIFEPYFTTKHQSQGTGIGLYMTREIIVTHMDGNIFVKNEKLIYNDKEYIGANFYIEIPISPKEV